MSLFDHYTLDGFYDEMFESAGVPRPHYKSLHSTLSSLNAREFRQRAEMAEMSMLNQGVTFTVYGDGQGLEKTMPVDLVPRILTHGEWERIERGLVQRLHVLNLFLHDVYHDQKILKDGVVPRELVVNAKHFRRRVFRRVCAQGHLRPHLRDRFGGGTTRATITSWKTTCVRRPASRTCCKTGC